MRVLIATDAWHPQVNGVVRTLESLARNVELLGSAIDFLTPAGFASIPLPTYPGLRFALPRPAEIASRIERARPDAIHVAIEGPVGFLARRYCVANGVPFTTSFTTRFPEYIAARAPFPLAWGYAALRRFHKAAALTMVATQSLKAELAERGFTRLKMWSRGVDTALFHPDRAIHLDFPHPIFMCVGRIAPEKNLEAFLALDLPGTKVVIGHGPQEAELRARFPEAKFLGAHAGESLAAHIAAADVFVFPSRTDTFGIVQLEALASGVPVAAFPVTGPKDVIADAPVGVLSDDLRQACLDALTLSRDACRQHALQFSWGTCAAQFLAHMSTVASSTVHARNPAHDETPEALLGSLGSISRAA